MSADFIHLLPLVLYRDSSLDFSVSTLANASYSVAASNDTSFTLAVPLPPSNRSQVVVSVAVERLGSSGRELSVRAVFAPSDAPSAPSWLPRSCFASRSFELYKPANLSKAYEKKPSATQVSGILIAVGAVAGLFVLTAFVLGLCCLWRHKRRTRTPSLKEIDPTNISIQVLKASN